MAVLVIADHDNASLKDSTNKTITAALALSGDVDVLVAGKDAKAAADAAAKVAGVRKVLLAESDELGQGLAAVGASFARRGVGMAAHAVGFEGARAGRLTPRTYAGPRRRPRPSAT